LKNIKLSSRKLESYKRAETPARELRYQLSNNIWDGKLLGNLLLSWMNKTGKIKYEKPV